MRHITIKTPQEIDAMQRAGRVVEKALLALQKRAMPGVTTAELNALAEEIIKSRGAVPSFLGYRGFPYAICASVNEQVVHGFPNKRKLKEGDILSIDVGAILDGWHGDAARTFLIGQAPPEVKKLVQETRQCFYEGLRYAREGYRISDISRAIQQYAEHNGYGVVRDLTGHGIGRNMHEPPDLPNFVVPGQGKGIRLERGMTLAIEPMINLGGAEVRILEDGWTVVTQDGKPSAHYENTIAITDGEPRLLTLFSDEQGPEVIGNV